jgi:hypothetical protein
VLPDSVGDTFFWSRDRRGHLRGGAGKNADFRPKR